MSAPEEILYTDSGKIKVPPPGAPRLGRDDTPTPMPPPTLPDVAAPLSGARERALALELSCRYLTPLLDVATPWAAELPALLDAWQVSEAELRDETNWVSLRFCEALTEWLAARLGADELAEKVTRAAYSPRALGMMYPLLRALGSPRAGYQRMPQFVGVLNKVSRVTVQLRGRGSAFIEYRPATAALRERSPLICRLRKQQLAAGPTLWGLPAAIVEESECQARGHDRCLYRLRWAERAGWLGTIAGAAAGLGIGVALPGPTSVTLIAALLGALAGRIVDERRQRRELRRFNEEQTRALSEAAAAMERRFVELEQAKRDVDHKVEARTAELKLAGGKLAESLARLEQLSRVKDEFLANVSHELRTPLTLILGPLEDLLVDAEEPRRGDLLLVQRNAVRLNAMVDDLLDLARLQAGQLHLSLTTFDLGDALERVVEQFRPLALRRGLALTLVSAPVPPLEGDPRRLEFVFANLLSNALKFTPAGGAVRVELARAAGGGVAVTVADTGPGIPEALQAHIFGRFNRFDLPGAAGAAGSGIGLALVKELVELHRGGVTVASEPGHGARFTVTLPLAQPADARVARDVPVPLRRSGLEVLSAPHEPQVLPAITATAALAADAPRVLVVEDHADMRAFIAAVLGRRYAVEAVAGAEEALAAVARQRCDAVVSDVMMPGSDGYELCRALKARAPTTPVLLLTARKSSEWALHGFAAGADDYLAKPFHPDELLARVDVQLRRRKLMDEAVQREKLATLGQLAAGLAHEVRNPVSAILAGLPRVQRELAGAALPAATREMVDVALECAQRIEGLVTDLLALGEPEREGPRPFHPHAGLEAALRVLRHRAAPGVELRCRFDFTGEVPGRPAALHQVFVNLVDNALAAVGERGVVAIATASGGEHGGVVITVDDSGPGVPEALRARIFDPFFTTKAPGVGTGLGLHVSRRIVHEHGGTLELTASALGGACFRIWLPA